MGENNQLFIMQYTSPRIFDLSNKNDLNVITAHDSFPKSCDLMKLLQELRLWFQKKG